MGSFEANGSHDRPTTESALEPDGAGAASVKDRAGGGDGRVSPAGSVPGRPLDPSSIGRLVEQKVATMLGAAAAEADRISSTAMVVVRKAEAKIAAL